MPRGGTLGIRRQQLRKLAEDFFSQCRALNEPERPSSLVAHAISYALTIEAELKKFLKDFRLIIDGSKFIWLARRGSPGHTISPRITCSCYLT